MIFIYLHNNINLYLRLQWYFVWNTILFLYRIDTNYREVVPKIFTIIVRKVDVQDNCRI